MKKLIGTAVFLAMASLSAHASTNVALGSTVAFSGPGLGDDGGWCSGCGTLTPFPYSSVVDGNFLPFAAQWNINTLYWTASPTAPSIVTITLPTVATVTGLTLQVDNNDGYAISWQDTSNNWHYLDTVTPPDYWGMDTVSTTFAPIVAKAFSVTGVVQSDYHFAISEFQAAGVVPEPETYALLLAGLGVMGAVARRRKAQQA